MKILISRILALVLTALVISLTNGVSQNIPELQWLKPVAVSTPTISEAPLAWYRTQKSFRDFDLFTPDPAYYGAETILSARSKVTHPTKKYLVVTCEFINAASRWKPFHATLIMTAKEGHPSWSSHPLAHYGLQLKRVAWIYTDDATQRPKM